MANNNNNNVGGIRRREYNSVKEYVPSAAWTEDSLHHFLLVDLPGFKKEEVKLEVEKSGEITISGERLLVNDNKYLYFKKTFKVPKNSDLEKITGKFEGEILYVNVPKQLAEKKIIEYPPPGNNIIEEDHYNKDGHILKGNMEEKKITGDAINQLKVQSTLDTLINKDKINQLDNQNEEEMRQEEKSKQLTNGNINEESDGVKKGAKNSNSMLEGAVFIIRKNGHILLTAALAFSLGVLLSRKF